MKKGLGIIFILSFILLATNIIAYQTCDGGYSPYPVKCNGEGSSVNSENTNPPQLIQIN